ncbi:MAG: hypothetical protein IPH02_00015 [Sphingobacteriales bacterium]|nr:hypothetical protein [Sphingobacteriales bacterium]
MALPCTKVFIRIKLLGISLTQALNPNFFRMPCHSYSIKPLPKTTALKMPGLGLPFLGMPPLLCTQRRHRPRINRSYPFALQPIS